MKDERGAGLVEVLVSMLIIVTACVATLAFFAYGMASISGEGDRRAALELARGRMEQLLMAPEFSIRPVDNQIKWLVCTGSMTCTWSLSTTQVLQAGNLNTLQNQQIEATSQWIDDPTAGTAGLDALELVIKVWYTPHFGVDDEFNRVQIRALRDV